MAIHAVVECALNGTLFVHQEEEDMGIAPSGRASYTAPSDVMADLPPNEQVNEMYMYSTLQNKLNKVMASLTNRACRSRGI